MRGFENVLKKMPCLGNPCNNSLLECFTKGVCLFEKMFQGFESCFESCVCEVCFEKWQGLFCKIGQVTKSYLP